MSPLICRFANPFHSFGLADQLRAEILPAVARIADHFCATLHLTTKMSRPPRRRSSINRGSRSAHRLPRERVSMSTEHLLDRSRRGDAAALTELLAHYRSVIRDTIALRLDRRLAARVDVSDVVQETYLEAARRMPEYLDRSAMPFHLWLRWLAREQVLVHHRRHLRADKRAISRETPLLPEDSSACLVRKLLDHAPSPSQIVATAEGVEKLREALGRLDDDEHDLILWRHFERLTNADLGQLLGINEAAAGKRYIRALEKLKVRLEELGVTGAE
jgi:RNA polymerase sigma-70 factor, ECF subfamily